MTITRDVDVASRADRMLAYEHATRTVLPTRTHTLIRVDGKAFHTFTRGMDRPFDQPFTDAMTATAVALAQQVDGAIAAYVQSDEISVLTSDLRGSHTQPWLGGVVAKIVSLTAAIATAEFGRAYAHPDGRGPALFDSRVFTINDPVDVADYFTHRHTDARRNALAMICDTHLGKKQTIGLGTRARLDLLDAAGVNLDGFPPGNLHGRLVTSSLVISDVTYTDKRTGELRTATNVARRVWNVTDAACLASPGTILGMLDAGADGPFPFAGEMA